jgi:type II secretory pathway component PulF
MTNYRYIALNKAGNLVRGSLEADSEHALYTALKGRDLFLQEAGTESKVFKRSSKVRQVDLIEFSHQMAFVVQSGIPFVQGLSDIQRSLKEPAFKSILEAVIHDLTAGDSLSQSLARHPQIFLPGYVAVIQAGETSGNMAASFRNMGRFLEWVLNLKRQISQALIYPIIVLIILSVAMILFVTLVIPQLSKFILELNRPIPLPTKILIWFNQFIQSWWPLLLVILAIVIVSAIIAMRFERVRYLWDQYKLKVPMLGDVFRDLACVRFVNYLKILYSAGIQIHQSFAILRDVVGNRFFRDKVDQMRGLVLGGESLSESMEKVGGFPPLLERSIQVGEKTGALDSTLEQLGGFLDAQIEANIKKLTSLLGPVLIIVIGLYIIFIIITVLWPIYQIIGEIG